jgi:hypothetical protein
VLRTPTGHATHFNLDGGPLARWSPEHDQRLRDRRHRDDGRLGRFEWERRFVVGRLDGERRFRQRRLVVGRLDGQWGFGVGRTDLVGRHDRLRVGWTYRVGRGDGERRVRVRWVAGLGRRHQQRRLAGVGRRQR